MSGLSDSSSAILTLLNGGITVKQQHYKGKKALMGLRNSLLILLLGITLGALGKWSDYHNMFLSNLTSGIQLWVLLDCALAGGTERVPAVGCAADCGHGGSPAVG